MAERIDYVVPYVTPRDPAWLALFREHFGRDYSEVRTVRFDENLLFRYAFRGLERHMPWIGRVHLVVQSEAQVPRWIDRGAVHVVLHDEFVPRELLPTFNSCTLECFMHRIPGLSDLFIYGNDDTYAVGDLSPGDFFRGRMPLYSLKYVAYLKEGETQHMRMCRRMFEAAAGEGGPRLPNGCYCAPRHCQQPFSKAIMARIFREHEEEVVGSVTKFRSESNFSQYFFIYAYMVSTGGAFSGSIPSLSLDLNTAMDEIVRTFGGEERCPYKLVCLNNNVGGNEVALLSAFDRMFPEKSRYEA